jgi:hypothetical protein
MACQDERLPTDVAFSATVTEVGFTVGPFTLTAISRITPDGRFHLRDVGLNGPVSGDLAGTANVVLQANLDQPGGSGPAWGTMTITEADGTVWQGGLTGSFLGFGPGQIQLFSDVVLHGPDQQVVTAACNETTATSETLICSGELLSAHP